MDCFSTAIHIFSSYLSDDTEFFNILTKISQILPITSIGWLLTQKRSGCIKTLSNQIKHGLGR